MSSKRILIVEDNEKNLKLIRDLMLYAGYETMEAVTGEEGVEKANRESPDLVLMDIQLPGLNGIEALLQLRSNTLTENIPVVAVTASAMTEDEQRIQSAGFDGYLRKPIDIDQVLATVKEILEG
ncbi:MAG: response regulator [Gammaproteobacteria bacterium]|nr:MAG: response regulator [Gammaproteobacteria bacterium]